MAYSLIARMPSSTNPRTTPGGESFPETNSPFARGVPPDHSEHLEEMAEARVREALQRQRVRSAGEKLVDLETRPMGFLIAYQVLGDVYHM